MTTVDERPDTQPFSLDGAYDRIDRHLAAIGDLRAAIAVHIDQQNRRASEVIRLGDAELTPAEARIARLLVTPMRAPEIARALRVSVNTVKTHMKNIYRKLGVCERRQAVEVLKSQGAKK